jgi:hypothetical protein
MYRNILDLDVGVLLLAVAVRSCRVLMHKQRLQQHLLAGAAAAATLAACLKQHTTFVIMT